LNGDCPEVPRVIIIIIVNVSRGILRDFRTLSTPVFLGVSAGLLDEKLSVITVVLKKLELRPLQGHFPQ
jgi:hypothetical protein